MMNYNEFKKNYTYATKRYPNLTNLPYDSDKAVCTLTKTREIKEGKKWVKKEQSTNDLTTEEYMNIVEAVPFFRNLGGTETVRKIYTRYGNIPNKIISTSPDKTQRSIYNFAF